LHRLSQQFSYSCVLAEEIPGPGQLLEAPQFGAALQESFSREWIARGIAMFATTLTEIFSIMRGH
jgi:hypothetical protein